MTISIYGVESPAELLDELGRSQMNKIIYGVESPAELSDDLGARR
jgi:hypothetical protein